MDIFFSNFVALSEILNFKQITLSYGDNNITQTFVAELAILVIF